MRTFRTLLALSLVAAWCSAAVADIPPPPKKKNERVVANVSIKYGAIKGEARNVHAKVVIPTYLVAGAVERAEEGGGATAPAPTAPAPAAAPPPPRIQLIPPRQSRSSLPAFGTTVAGIAMSLAAVSVVFLVRGSGRTKTAAVIALVAAGLLGGWSIAQADVALPGSRGEPIIVIELSDDADVVTLQLPR